MTLLDGLEGRQVMLGLLGAYIPFGDALSILTARGRGKLRSLVGSHLARGSILGIFHSEVCHDSRLKDYPGKIGGCRRFPSKNV